MKRIITRILFAVFCAVFSVALFGCGDNDKSKEMRYVIEEDAFIFDSFSLSEDGKECTVTFYCRNSLDGVTAYITYLDREGKSVGSDKVTKPISYSATASERGEITFAVLAECVGKVVDLRVTFEGTSKIDPAFSVGWHTVTYYVDGKSFSRQTVMHGKSAKMPADLPEKEYGVFAGWLDEEGKPFDFSSPVIHNLDAHAIFAPNDESIKSITVSVETAYQTAEGDARTVSGCGILFYRSDAKNRYYLLTADSLVRPADAVSASYTVKDSENNSYEALTFPVIMEDEKQEEFDARVAAFSADATVCGISVLYFVSDQKDHLGLLDSVGQADPAVGDTLYSLGFDGGTPSITEGTVTAYRERQPDAPDADGLRSFTGIIPILEYTTEAENATVGNGLMSFSGLCGIVTDVKKTDSETTLLATPISVIMRFLNIHVFA